MSLLDLPKLLIGNRGAIERAANSRGLVWLGLLFVISAALAREYDGEDLLHEPWYLLAPPLASLATSLLLYLILVGLSIDRELSPARLVEGYSQFLGLYWMTAPLAWLYALPVERILSPADATRANLIFLGIVAGWRVLLITRIVSVQFRFPYLAALMPVMLMADGVVLIILLATPWPVFDVMGGIRLSESEQLMQAVRMNVTVIALATAPIWLFTTMGLDGFGRWKQFRPRFLRGDEHGCSQPRVAWPLWLLAGLSIGIWAALLPAPQREQQNRRHVERLIGQENYTAAITYLNSRERRDFPPHWDPPPRIGYGDRMKSLIDVVETALIADARPWVLATFTEKLEFQARGFDAVSGPIAPHRMDDDELARYVDLLGRLPNGERIAARHHDFVQAQLKGSSPAAHESPDRRRELYEALLRIAGGEKPAGADKGSKNET